MLVLKLQDGSPYVFPSLLEMQDEIRVMQTNVVPPGLVPLEEELTAIAETGVAEVDRLKFLKSMVNVRMKAAKAIRGLPPEASGNTSLAAATADQKESQEAMGPVHDFLKGNMGVSVDDFAVGKQALDTLRNKADSDNLDVDRAIFLDSRSRFWARELQVALSWIDARISYLSSQYGVS